MNKRAVIVGITNYESPSPIIEAAVPEAENWRDLLINFFGFSASDILIRRDAEATISVVLADIQNALTGAGPNDQIVFIHCGHGAVKPITPTSAQEGLLMYHSRNGDRLAATLTDSDLSGVVQAARPSADADFTIILDCCFAGGILGDAAAQVLDATAEKEPLFVQLLDVSSFERLTTILRFGSLWDIGENTPATIDPLVIAACQRGRLAAQLPIVPGSPPHLVFSACAIPALQAQPAPSHVELQDAINHNPLSFDQYATLLGNVPRRPHVFLT